MMKTTAWQSTFTLAASITKAASKQTYYTIRFLVDRERIADAYCAYAYFRWVDDTLDAGDGSRAERVAFVNRQKALLERGYRGEFATDLTPEEKILVRLIQYDLEKDSGLQTYLRSMMALMVFDVERRGKLISQAELEGYTQCLARAVTEALHYFIGHNCYAPHDEARYQAVTAAHIAHMLRDMVEDVQAGYYNIPNEVLKAHHLAPQDMQSDAFRDWVHSRVQQARENFQAGRAYLNRVESFRCKIAGLAYTARFEWLLDTMERDGYALRAHYNPKKSFKDRLQVSWLMLSSIINRRWTKA